MAEVEDADVSMRDMGVKVREDLQRLRDAARRQSSQLLARWRDFLDRQPELAVAAAFGAGFLLSGALVSGLTTRVASTAARFYLRRVVHEAVRGLTGELGELLGGLTTDDSAAPDAI